MRSITLLTLATILFSCNSGKKSDFKPSKADTIRTLGTYVDFNKKEILSDALYIVCKDSFMFPRGRTDTLIKTWNRDTMAFIPFIIVDSTKRDSLGHPTKVLKYIPTLREGVSFNFNLDSAINELKRFMANNPQVFGRK